MVAKNLTTGQPYTTDLFIPQYIPATVGRWSIEHSTFEQTGYYGDRYAVTNAPCLYRSNPRELWMSVTPAEIETMATGIRMAHGNVVCAGLGMGWAAENIALNPKVKSVTVLEMDSDVIHLYYKQPLYKRPRKGFVEKIAIFHKDALIYTEQDYINDIGKELGADGVDFLFADIWHQIACPETVPDTMTMLKNLGYPDAYIWGQEIIMRRDKETGNSSFPMAVTKWTDKAYDYDEMVKKAGKAWERK